MGNVLFMFSLHNEVFWNGDRIVHRNVVHYTEESNAESELYNSSQNEPE